MKKQKNMVMGEREQTEREGEMIDHKVAAKRLLISQDRMIEALRKSLVPIQRYEVILDLGNPSEEIWWLNEDDVQELGIKLRQEDYGDVPLPTEFQLGVRSRLYNWTLRVARLKMGLRTKDLSKIVGISKETIYMYESLRAFPKEEVGQRIAEVLNVPVDVLFPQRLRGLRLRTAAAAIQDAHFSLEQAVERRLLAPVVSADPQDIAEKIDLKKEIQDLLTSLKPNEQRVISLRFGLDGRGSRTLYEVGRELEVSPERIRQIEVKALRGLRHSIRSRRLTEYLV